MELVRTPIPEQGDTTSIGHTLDRQLVRAALPEDEALSGVVVMCFCSEAGPYDNVNPGPYNQTTPESVGETQYNTDVGIMEVAIAATPNQRCGLVGFTSVLFGTDFSDNKPVLLAFPGTIQTIEYDYDVIGYPVLSDFQGWWNTLTSSISFTIQHVYLVVDGSESYSPPSFDHLLSGAGGWGAFIADLEGLGYTVHADVLGVEPPNDVPYVFPDEDWPLQIGAALDLFNAL